VRLIVTLILIALLPLRSWTGDVMSVQMAGQAMHHAMAAPTPSSAPVQSNVNCHEMGEPVAAVLQQEVAQDNGSDGDCDTCISCQVCSSVAAIEPAFKLDVIRKFPFAVPLQAASVYVSAELALGQKPPIS